MILKEIVEIGAEVIKEHREYLQDYSGYYIAVDVRNRSFYLGRTDDEALSSLTASGRPNAIRESYLSRVGNNGNETHIYRLSYHPAPHAKSKTIDQESHWQFSRIVRFLANLLKRY